MRKLLARVTGPFALAATAALALLVPLTGDLSPACVDGLYHAGVTQITVQNAVPFDVLVACPTDAADASFQSGPFTISLLSAVCASFGKVYRIVNLQH